MTDLMSSLKERLKRYRRHALDAYTKAHDSNDPYDREVYIRMAEAWNQLADAMEDHLKRHKIGDADS